MSNYICLLFLFQFILINFNHGLTCKYSFCFVKIFCLIISFLYIFFYISYLVHRSFNQIKNKDLPRNFTNSRFKYYSLGAYSGSDLVSNSLNSCAQECEENEFCFLFKYENKECLTFRKVCSNILVDSSDSTLYSKEMPDSKL
jgi:hypothetical protein